MPKNNRLVKLDGLIKKFKVASKLRVGTRRSGKSANLMSNDKLLDVVTSSNHKKDIKNAKTVLTNRGVTV